MYYRVSGYRHDDTAVHVDHYTLGGAHWMAISMARHGPFRTVVLCLCLVDGTYHVLWSSHHRPAQK